MISSCCTLRLKRRSAFSRDSLSWIMTSATFTFTPNPVRIGYVRWYCLVRTPPLVIIARQPPRGHAHRCRRLTKSPHRAVYKNMLDELHIDLRTLARSGVTLRYMASSNQLGVWKSRNLCRYSSVE